MSTKIAEKIVALGADYLLALKGNQPTLAADVAEYFRTAPNDRVENNDEAGNRGRSPATRGGEVRIGVAFAPDQLRTMPLTSPPKIFISRQKS